MDERVLVEPVAFYLGVDESPYQVVVLTSAPSLFNDPAYVLDVLDERSPRAIHRGRIGRSLSFEHVVGPAQEVVASFGIDPEKITDGDEGKGCGDIAHEVALTSLTDLVENVVAYTADPTLALAHTLRGESLAHEPPPALVLGGVHVDHHGQCGEVGPDATCARKRLGILRDVLQVAVPGYPPDTVAAVEVCRSMAAHPGEGRKRISGIKGSVDQVDGDGRRVGRVDGGGHRSRSCLSKRRRRLSGQRRPRRVDGPLRRCQPQLCR